MGRTRQRCGIVWTDTCGVVTHTLEGYHKLGGPHWGVRSLRPMCRPTCTRKMSPHKVWLWKLAELTSRKAGCNPSSWVNPGLTHPPGLTPPKQLLPSLTPQCISASTKVPPNLLCPTQQVVLTSTASKTAFTSGAQPRTPARPPQQLQPGITATYTE